MTIGTVWPMRRSVFCTPSTSVVGVSPMSQDGVAGAQTGSSRRRCPGRRVLTTMTPFSRWKVKSMRSNEERLRWNETNAPRIDADREDGEQRVLTRTDLRIDAAMRIQCRCRAKMRG